MIKKLFRLVLATMLVALGTVPALAVDSKSISASACIGQTNGWFAPAPGTTTYSQWQYGGIDGYILAGGSPGSTSWTYVNCPLLRDDISNTNGLANLSIAVWDHTASDYVSCTATASDLTTTMGYTYGPVATTTAFNGGVQLLSLNVLQSFNGGAYSVTCRLPHGQSGIRNINYAEHLAGSVR